MVPDTVEDAGRLASPAELPISPKTIFLPFDQTAVGSKKTYTTWSVGRVFWTHLDTFEHLSLQDLTLKLAISLALTSAACVHELI